MSGNMNHGVYRTQMNNLFKIVRVLTARKSIFDGINDGIKLAQKEIIRTNYFVKSKLPMITVNSVQIKISVNEFAIFMTLMQCDKAYLEMIICK